MRRGRQSARIYLDLLLRRLRTTHQRLAVEIEQIQTYNRTAKEYEVDPVPKATLNKHRTARKHVAATIRDLERRV